MLKLCMCIALGALLVSFSCALPQAEVYHEPYSPREVTWEASASEDEAQDHINTPLDGWQGTVGTDTTLGEGQGTVGTDATLGEGQGTVGTDATLGEGQGTPGTADTEDGERKPTQTEAFADKAPRDDDRDVSEELRQIAQSVDRLTEQIEKGQKNISRLRSAIIISTLSGAAVLVIGEAVLHYLRERHIPPVRYRVVGEPVESVVRRRPRADRSPASPTAAPSIREERVPPSDMSRDDCAEPSAECGTAKSHLRDSMTDARAEVMSCYMHGRSHTEEWQWYGMDTSCYDDVLLCLANGRAAYDRYLLKRETGSKAYYQYALIDGKYLFPSFHVQDALTPAARLQQVLKTGDKYLLEAIFDCKDRRGVKVSLRGLPRTPILRSITPAIVERKPDGSVKVTKMGEMVFE